MARTVWTSDGQFQVEVGTAEYERLLSEGREFVADQPSGDSADEPPVEGAFETWKFPQLKARAEDLGILDTVEGTGKSGAITKPDLVKALNAHEPATEPAEGETLGEGGE
jgi:pyruvate/2-oxoglutarate dehydrogenase complex dihydrolipoamide acyltransferase (E2) component